MPDWGWQDRPDYADLLDTVGFVESIWISQEGETDELRFRLRIGWSGGTEMVTFRIPLHISTHVGLAQLQLLRDALRYSWDWLTDMRARQAMLVRVRFNFADISFTTTYAYHVRIMPADPTATVDSYFQTTPTTWYLHGTP